MISCEFNISEFIDAVIDKDKFVILNAAESEAKEAEKISEIKGLGQDYVEFLTGFIYFLRYYQKPDNITDEQFQMFRPICEKLAAKKQLSPDELKIFDSTEY